MAHSHNDSQRISQYPHYKNTFKNALKTQALIGNEANLQPTRENWQQKVTLRGSQVATATSFSLAVLTANVKLMLAGDIHSLKSQT